MENASKALIIAGSILISIIVISLGVVVFRNMSGSVERNANLNQQQISSFNSKITPYIGNNISGSQVNALIQLVRTINQKALNTNDNVQRVSIYYGSEKMELKSGDTAVNGDLRRVPTGTYYKVDGEFDSNGLITKITISQ